MANQHSKSFPITKEELEELYFVKKLSLSEIGEKYGCGRKLIRRLCRDYNIIVRPKGYNIPFERPFRPFLGKKLSKEHKEKISKALKGRIVHTETKKKMSIAVRKRIEATPNFMKGENNPMYGKKRPTEFRHRLSDLQRKFTIDRETLYRLYWDEGLTMKEIGNRLGVSYDCIYRATRRFDIKTNRKPVSSWNKGMRPKEWIKIPYDEFLKHRAKCINIKPTKIESKIMDIIKHYQFSFKYVGNGEVWIDGKNPDFIECNGKKQLIEVFGTYWHKREDEQIRKEHFAKYGFQTLIFWEDEIHNSHDEEIAMKIKRFTEGEK